MKNNVIFFFSDSFKTNELYRSLNVTHRVFYMTSYEEFSAYLKDNIPDLIIFETSNFESVNLILENKLTSWLEYLPMLWFPKKEISSNKELLLCYEKGVSYVAGKEDRRELLLSRIKGVFKKNEQKEYFLKRKLLMGKNKVLSQDKNSDLLNRIYKYLSNNLLQNDFCIEKMGNDMGMSRTNFYNKIKSVTGMSPSRMVMEYRLKMATHLLYEKTETISEIAYQLGFSSTAYFSKCFKEKYNQQPSAYSGFNE